MSSTTPEADRRAIEASLEAAGDRAGDLTAAVYARLFAAHPEMQALFVRDTEGLVRGEMLMRVFEAILDFIGPRRYAATMIGAEVVTHEGYDVPRSVFATFFPFVRDTVRAAASEAWTPETEAAWTGLLADLDSYVARPAQVA